MLALNVSALRCYVSTFSTQRNLYEENSGMLTACCRRERRRWQITRNHIDDRWRRRRRCRYRMRRSPSSASPIPRDRKHSPNMTSMNYLYARYSYFPLSLSLASSHSITSIFIRIESRWNAKCTIALNVPRWQQSTRTPDTVSRSRCFTVRGWWCEWSVNYLLACELESVMFFHRNRRLRCCYMCQPSATSSIRAHSIRDVMVSFHSDDTHSVTSSW